MDVELNEVGRQQAASVCCFVTISVFVDEFSLFLTLLKLCFWV